MFSFDRTHKRLLILLSLIALPLVAFGPSAFQSEFVSLDDTLLITKNGAVQEFTLRSVIHVFSSYDPELYVPLTLFSYQIEHALFGLNPAAFHITNLLLHIGSAVIVFFLFRRVLKSDFAGWIVALLFAIHPLNTEAVLWAAARKDVLSTFFFLLSLFFYERSNGESKDSSTVKREGMLSIVSFLLALLSKVTVIPLPVVLLLLDWQRGERLTVVHIRKKWAYFALAFVFAVIAAFGKTKNIGSLSALQYVLIAGKSTVFYLWKMVWPVNLSVVYSQGTPITLGSAEFLAPLILTLILAVAAVLMIRIHRGIALGLLFFFVTLPVNYFNVWKNGYLFFASDRYAYIPSIGIFVVLAVVLTKGAAMLRPYNRYGASIIGGMLLVLVPVLAFLSFVQAATWKNSETLYQQGLTVSPDSSLLHVNLGDVYVREGKEDEGLEEFKKAIAVDPGNIVALTNAGNIYRERGDMAKAQEFYEAAVKATPENPFVEQLMGYYLLAELLLNQGHRDRGFTLLQQATQKGAQYAEPFFNLGVMLQRHGRSDEAVSAYETAIEIDGTYLAARYNLAALYAERGKLTEAREQLRAVVARDPKYGEARKHLENIERLTEKAQ